ncbi:MAG: HD domain-containing protein [Acidobacteria bacterium]|nr:HD domain-containing protein [Acidobacteriota bacterium]
METEVVQQRLEVPFLNWFDQFGMAVKRVNPELLVVFLIVLVAGTLNALVIQDPVFLNIYGMVVVIAAFLFGKRKATLSAFLCMLVVVMLAYSNPTLFRLPEGHSFSFTVWASIAAWGGVLLLTASLVGTLYERQQRAFHELRNIYYGILEILSTFVSRDKHLQHHSFRVSVYGVKIGRRMGFDAERLEDIRAAGLLHDIGKLEISRDILCKAARLNPEEFEEIKTHVAKGHRIISPVAGSLGRVLPIILGHHDRFDGSGYNSSKGDEIPLEARVLSVADVYDALTTDRPYRKAMSPFEARDIILQGSGKDFDPIVVQAFSKAFDRGEMEIVEVAL